MKIDDKKKQTLTARRTLKNFTDALEKLLRKTPFEKISITDICNEAMIPRATFYNYFEDKYDLLDYFCWVYTQRFEWEEPAPDADIGEYLRELFEKILVSMQENADVYKEIYQTNANGYFIQHIRNYMKKQLTYLLSETNDPQTSMPVELESDLLASMVVSMCTWWIYHSDEYTIEDLRRFMNEIVDRSMKNKPAE